MVVRMTRKGNELSDVHLRPKPVAHLARKSLNVGLSLLNATTRELPHQRKDRGSSPLRDEVPPVLFQDSSDDADRR